MQLYAVRNPLAERGLASGLMKLMLDDNDDPATIDLP
jgi:hypothetical protein